MMNTNYKENYYSTVSCYLKVTEFSTRAAVFRAHILPLSRITYTYVHVSNNKGTDRAGF